MYKKHLSYIDSDFSFQINTGPKTCVYSYSNCCTCKSSGFNPTAYYFSIGKRKLNCSMGRIRKCVGNFESRKTKERRFVIAYINPGCH